MTDEFKSDLPIADEVKEPPVQETPTLTPEEESAAAKGWKPKEKWIEEGGAEEDWKPAKIFNEIGNLKERLSVTERELKKSNKIAKLMRDHHLQVRQTAIEEALRQLKAERVAALDNQDFATAEKLRDKEDDIRRRAENDKALPPELEQEIQDAPTYDPEFFEFMDRNPWYKPQGRDEMSRKADAIGIAVRQENPDISYTELLKRVEKDIKKLYSEKFSTPKSPVTESGARGGTGGGGESVKLSDQELEVARGFGMTPEQYAKELKSYKGR